MRAPPLRSLVVALVVTLLAGGCPYGESSDDPPADPLSFVDATIGTGGGGFGQPQTFVGAARPWGFVRLGPDSAGELPRDVVGFAHTSGYWYADGFIEGFSHLHLSGTGIEDLGNVLVMPAFGMTTEKTREEGYRQRFDHATEAARAGLYTVTLDDTGVEVELTTTTHAGVHRYTFPSSADVPRDAPATLIIDVGHGLGRDGAGDAELTYDPATGVLEGTMTSIGRFTGAENGFTVAFSLAISPTPVAFGTFAHDALSPDATTAQGPTIGAWVELADDVTEVVVRAGLSLIDVPSARAHRAAVDERSFGDVRAESEEAWRERLSALTIVSDDEETLTMVYTGLYHALLHPTLLSEEGADGDDGTRSVRLDRAVVDDEGAYYSDLSMWDTYRTAHPLYALLYPDDASRFAASIVDMADAHGALPRWPLFVNETGVMLGTPASIILADTWLRGARDFDVERALAWMKDDADGVAGRSTRGVGHARCLALGFCPMDEVARSVAAAIEWGAADAALAALLAARGDDDGAARYRAQTALVGGHYDPATGFLRGRTSDGAFASVEDFDATAMDDVYAEGNAWQYLFAAPHATALLVDAMGGADAFRAALHAMFDAARDTPPRFVIDDFRAADPYYWHGNEPDLHAPFLFTLAGDVDASTRVVDWIRATKYDTTPDGLDGNDDAGTLSAWLVLAAVGLFPLPGTDVWILSPPFFDRMSLARPGGALEIVVDRASPSSRFIAGVTLDDVALDRAFVHHAEVAAATTLRFTLVDEPRGFGAARPFVDEGE